MTLVVDSSAIIAIVTAEPEGEMLARRLEEDAGDAVIAAPTVLETLMVLSGQAKVSASEIERLFSSLGIEAVPFTSELALLAHDAFLRFGRGRHSAKLNFGDCMSYALAKSLDAPLLFKGKDFPRTDIRSAL
jgi:ribonuclease VapC